MAEGEDGECLLCGKEVVAVQGGVRLFKRCNHSAPGAAPGRELEGFMLASWCLSRLGGEAWMRTMMLSKSQWRRWRRALRSEERPGGAEEWWWRLLVASVPEEEREVIRMAHGKALNAAEWKEWWSGERGTQGHSLPQGIL